jgi:hypothetical protein
MIDICKKNINKEEIKFINQDICEVDIKNTSIIILNLTLQFVDHKKKN